MVAENLPRDELPPTKFKVWQKDNILTVTDTADSSHDIDLRDWTSCARQSILDIRSALVRLLPSIETGVSLEKFPLHKISDNYSRAAIHRQKHNADWLTPMRHTIRQGLFSRQETTHVLFSPTGIHRERVEAWLSLDQNFLAFLATTLALTGGPGIDAGQYQHLHFDSTETHCRDVWLSPDSTLMVTNPFAVLHDDNRRTCILSFPLEAAKIVLFYLTLLRPIACELLQLIGKDTPLYSTRIWAHWKRHPRPTSEWTWIGPEIHRHLRFISYTRLGVALTHTTIRLILRTLFQQRFPQLYHRASVSIVDDQAQHIYFTSLNNYGRLSYFPRIANIKPDQPIRFLSISQIWQAVVGVGPICDTWQEIALESPLVAWTLPKQDQAFQVARNLVFSLYLINQGRESIKEKVQDLLFACPFLHLKDAQVGINPIYQSGG